MIERYLYNRFKAADPGLTLCLSILITGSFHRMCPEYLNCWLTFLGIGAAPVNYIQLAGCFLILVGGIGACIRYFKNPALRKWNLSIFNQGRVS